MTYTTIKTATGQKRTKKVTKRTFTAMTRKAVELGYPEGRIEMVAGRLQFWFGEGNEHQELASQVTSQLWKLYPEHLMYRSSNGFKIEFVKGDASQGLMLNQGFEYGDQSNPVHY